MHTLLVCMCVLCVCILCVCVGICMSDIKHSSEPVLKIINSLSAIFIFCRTVC